ncbi:hypothetical protein ACFL0M_12060 [Thermodesulfobacteriota bacterium]
MAFRVRTALGERTKEKDESAYGSSSSEALSQKMAVKGPVPQPDVKTVAPAEIPPTPQSTSETITSAEAQEFLFELSDLKMSAEALTFFIVATNQIIPSTSHFMMRPQDIQSRP